MDTILALILIAVLTGFLVLFVYTLFRGAPSVPSKRSAVATMLELAEPRPGSKAVDLGSGDGRLVIALARRGVEAHGYELNPLLVLWAKWRIRRAGLSDQAFAHWRNLWKVDTRPFDLVVLFGIPGIMPQLGRKLEQEMRPGSRVVSNIFTFPDWRPDKSRLQVHRYIIGRTKSVQ